MADQYQTIKLNKIAPKQADAIIGRLSTLNRDGVSVFLIDYSVKTGTLSVSFGGEYITSAVKTAVDILSKEFEKVPDTNNVATKGYKVTTAFDLSSERLLK